MTNADFATVKSAAVGRWMEILTYLGTPAHALSGKHCKCPGCGGKDRFRWDSDKDAYFCGGGGNLTGGDGFSLLEHCGWTNSSALHAVAQYLGLDRVMLSPEQREEIQKRKQQAKNDDLDDGIYHECYILMQTTAGRKNNRELGCNRKFREARPDWIPCPKEVWERELLAAQRLTRMLEVRYDV